MIHIRLFEILSRNIIPGLCFVEIELTKLTRWYLNNCTTGEALVNTCCTFMLHNEHTEKLQATPSIKPRFHIPFHPLWNWNGT